MGKRLVGQLSDLQQPAQTSPPHLTQPARGKRQRRRPSSKPQFVEAYRDSAVVSIGYLFYGEKAFPLAEITAVQIVKPPRQWLLEGLTKPTCLYGLAVAALGTALALLPLWSALRSLGGLAAGLALLYWVLTAYMVEGKKIGEYGLALDMALGERRIVTSHNLKAIQNLYEVLFRGLSGIDPESTAISVNMYTGDMYSDRNGYL